MSTTHDPARAPGAPLWLRALGVVSLVAIFAALAYAVAIAAVNFERIGV